MAFLYQNQDYSKLTDEQMISDVLITHNMIEAEIRDILWRTKIIAFNGSTKKSVFELSRIFTDACIHKFGDRDKSLLHIDDDFSSACSTYENFIIPEISHHLFEQNPPVSTHLRIQEKYQQYSRSVDKWFDFYMLSLDEKIKLLNYK